MRQCPALRPTLRLARWASTRASSSTTHAAAMANPSPKPVVTAFITSAADGAQSRILLLRRSAAVRCAGDGELRACAAARCADVAASIIRTYPGKWHGVSGGIEVATGLLAETPLERALVEVEVHSSCRAPLVASEHAALAGRDVHPASLAAIGVPRSAAARGRRRAFVPGAPAAVLDDGRFACCDAELGKRRGAVGAARRGGRVRRGAVAGAYIRHSRNIQ